MPGNATCSVEFNGIRYLSYEILDGDRYDGSDFVLDASGLRLISSRALDWMLETRIAPFEAFPRLLSYRSN